MYDGHTGHSWKRGVVERVSNLQLKRKEEQRPNRNAEFDKQSLDPRLLELVMVDWSG